MSGFAINQLTISGNLTSEPVLRHLPSGQALCKLRIAHNERLKLADGSWISQPQYFDVTIWGAIGSWVAKHVAKGDQVVSAGRPRWREHDTTRSLRTIVGQVVDPTRDRHERILRRSAIVVDGFDPQRFTATRGLDGERVLLIDDTWTTGAHAQTAAAALLDNGASTVAALVIGRFINPGFGDNAARLAAVPRTFSWETCALHGRRDGPRRA